ncbi:MAG: DUF1990 family protein [Pyrinomonadaceae bacterium]
MFLTHRPTKFEIEKFIDESSKLPLSYHPVGLSKDSPAGFNVDSTEAVVGHGAQEFAFARQALNEWRHFQLGWVELFPRTAATRSGTVVAVLVRHLGIWSLNGCRVVVEFSGEDEFSPFGFAYGTLTNHAEMGEESFEVSITESDVVTYRIRAVSRPRAALARLGYPFARFCQHRFRQDSLAAMRRAVARNSK